MTSKPPPESYDFEKDLYYQTFTKLDEHLQEGVENIFQPFPMNSRLGWLRRWWSQLMILPLLFALVFLILWKLGLVSQLYGLSEFALGALGKTDIGEVNIGSFTMLWFTKAYQIFPALLGSWIGVGKGKRGRKAAMLIMAAILAFIYIPPPAAPKSDLTLPTAPWDGIIFAFLILVITPVSYSLGIKMGEFLSLITATWYPFRKVLPAAGGRPATEVTSHAYQLLKRGLADRQTIDTDLMYVLTSAQAHLDASETMSLPWGILIAVLSLNLLNLDLPSVIEDTIQLVVAFGVITIVLIVFFITYHTVIQTSIIQAGAQIRRERGGDASYSSRSECDSPVICVSSLFNWLWKGKR